MICQACQGLRVITRALPARGGIVCRPLAGITYPDWNVDQMMHASHCADCCPGHVGSEIDPKICERCGTHVDSLRPGSD